MNRRAHSNGTDTASVPARLCQKENAKPRQHNKPRRGKKNRKQPKRTQPSPPLPKRITAREAGTKRKKSNGNSGYPIQLHCFLSLSSSFFSSSLPSLSSSSSLAALIFFILSSSSEPCSLLSFLASFFVFLSGQRVFLPIAPNVK